jgi:predicted protein tyrosine phosphatase
MADPGIAARLPFRVSVCSRQDVASFATRNVTHLLSIDNPGDPTPTPAGFKGPHRHVTFQDVESEAEARLYQAVAATRDDIQRVLDCGTECLQASRSGRVHLLVHCMAGASRSPAAAFAILTMLLGPGSEPAALAYLLEIKPDAFPNRLVVQLADDLLKRNGKMLAALRPLRDEVNEAIDRWMIEMRRRRPSSK